MTLFETGVPRKKLTGQLICFGIWIAITGIAAFLKPDVHHHGTHTQLGLPPCPSVLLFNRPCPGCGLTTSWTALVHGNFSEAFRAHPFGPLLYLVFTLFALSGVFGWATCQRLRTESKPLNTGMIGVFTIVLVFGLFRFATTVYDEPNKLAIFGSLNRTGEQSGKTSRVPEQNPATNVARPSQLK